MFEQFRLLGFDTGCPNDLPLPHFSVFAAINFPELGKASIGIAEVARICETRLEVRID